MVASIMNCRAKVKKLTFAVWNVDQFCTNMTRKRNSEGCFSKKKKKTLLQNI